MFHVDIAFSVAPLHDALETVYTRPNMAECSLPISLWSSMIHLALLSYLV